MSNAAPIMPYTDKRPWGEFRRFTENISSTIKLIRINPGESLSLQKHEKRDEFWHIVSGEGIAEIGEIKRAVSAGTELYVPRLTLHRLSAVNDTLVILEIATGEHEEKDVKRLEDKYNRT